MFKWLARWGVTLGGSGAVLAVLLHSLGGSGAIWAAFGSISAPGLAGAIALSALAIILGVARWLAVLRAMGFRVRLGAGLHATLAVWPLAVIAPSRSNELLRALILQDEVPLWSGAGSVLVEKLLDLHTLLWIGLVGVAAQGLWRWAGGMLLAILSLWIGGLAAWKWGERMLGTRLLRRFQTKVAQIRDAFRAVVAQPLQALWISGLSVVVRLVTVGVLASLLWGMHASVGTWTIGCLAPAAFLMGLLPVSLAGIGVRDAAFLWLLDASGHAVPSRGAVVAATLTYSLVSTWLFAGLSLPIMIRAGWRLGAGGRAARSREWGSVAGDP